MMFSARVCHQGAGTPLLFLVGAALMHLASSTALAQSGRDVPRRDSALVGPQVPPGPPPRSIRVAYQDSLKHPESVIYDSDLDMYYVSNINGVNVAKDGNGFISRLRGDGSKDRLRWIVSGMNGVTLNAPKGMAIVGDMLWVTDIDQVRSFNRRTGAPGRSIDLMPSGAAFLNDLVAGPDGALYVTDTGIGFDANGNYTHPRPDRVFRITTGGVVSVALSNDRLMRPNGIAWDQANARFVVVSFAGDSIFGWRPGSTELLPIATGLGQFDGVVVTPTGSILVTSKATFAVHMVRGNTLTRVVDRVGDPADIDYDPRRQVVAVPLTAKNRIEFYKIPVR